MEECKTKFVPKLTKKINATLTRKIKKTIKEIKIKLKNETDKEESKTLKNQLNSLNKMIKKSQDKDIIDMYINNFCNPGCVGTQFQEAEYSDADLEKKFDWCENNCNKKEAIENFKKTRKTLKKGRKTILKDNFYHAFDAKTKKRLIKEGALSGCVVGL